MKSRFIILVLAICVVMVSCDGGPKSKTKTSGSETNTGLTANITNGKIFFDSNCGGCHAAGADDTDSAFGDKALMDLKNNQKVVNNMSQLGGSFELMNRFSNLSPQRVLDLKTYLNDPNL